MSMSTVLTNARIKELYLGYTFDKLIRGAKVSVALTARNLLMLYCKAPFDPEATSSTDIYYQGFDYFMQPSQRSLGFSINVNSKIMKLSERNSFSSSVC